MVHFAKHPNVAPNQWQAPYGPPRAATFRPEISTCGPANFAGLGGKRPTGPPAPKTRASDIDALELENSHVGGSNP